MNEPRGRPLPFCPHGWHACDSDEAAKLGRALRAELAEDHPLFAFTCTAVLRARGSDDVLFACSPTDQPFALVHLTWSGRKEKPPWPCTRIFATVEEWNEFAESGGLD